MASNPDRSSYFPAIEKKYGEPVSFWFDQIAEISDRKYLEQIAYLRENFGFTQTHANALVLYARGSTTSVKYENVGQYLSQFDETKQATVHSIFEAMTDKYPTMQVVIAWNHPFGKIADRYIIGVSVHQKHILLGPAHTEVLTELVSELAPYVVNKKTFKVPVDWKVDTQLMCQIVELTLNS
jgi:uncharacterized protein YdhG (YjbR/CyaY superfamily)